MAKIPDTICLCDESPPQAEKIFYHSTLPCVTFSTLSEEETTLPSLPSLIFLPSTHSRESFFA
jgi:hypothetical protein